MCGGVGCCGDIVLVPVPGLLTWVVHWLYCSLVLVVYLLPSQAPNATHLMKHMKRFMVQFRQLVQADRSALKIQVLYRARLIKFLYKNIKAAGVLEKAKKAYAKEMAELHDGTKVRAVVQRDRKKEKREYQIFLMEEEKARRLEALYWVVEWPWVETWDEANECYTYWHEKLEASKYEKPTYTIDQENSVFVLQKWCRHLIEMRLMKEWAENAVSSGLNTEMCMFLLARARGNGAVIQNVVGKPVLMVQKAKNPARNSGFCLNQTNKTTKTKTLGF